MIESARVRLPVVDVERALRFYIERLGVKLVSTARVDLGGGFEVDFVLASQPAPAQLALCVRGDFDEALGTYENRGLALSRGRDTVGPYAECTDPDGHQLRFVPA